MHQWWGSPSAHDIQLCCRHPLPLGRWHSSRKACGGCHGWWHNSVYPYIDTQGQRLFVPCLFFMARGYVCQQTSGHPISASWGGFLFSFFTFFFFWGLHCEAFEKEGHVLRFKTQLAGQPSSLSHICIYLGIRPTPFLDPSLPAVSPETAGLYAFTGAHPELLSVL